MYKKLNNGIGLMILIIIVGCSKNNNSLEEKISQENISGSQAEVITKTLPEDIKEKDESVRLRKENRKIKAEFADIANFPAEAALGAVGHYQAKPSADYMHTPNLLSSIRQASEPNNRENYAHYDDNPIKLVNENPVSTFSIDVDTGSYANVRRMLNVGQLPIQDAVRAEELINYFSYDYPNNAQENKPFAVVKEMAPSPWNPDQYLLHLGIKAQDQINTEIPNANLVFLIDVSGSMQSANKIDTSIRKTRLMYQFY